jgi:rhamnogalacturonan endolyase
MAACWANARKAAEWVRGFELQPVPPLLQTGCMLRTLLAFVVLTAAASGQTLPRSAPQRGSAAPPVTLVQASPGVYVADNGIVRLTLDGPKIAVTSLQYHGEEFVAHSGRQDHIYWSMGGAANSQVSGDASCTVRSSTPEMADIGCVHRWTGRRDPHPVDVEIHYVVRQRVPGVYAYAILRHPAAYPALTLDEWRMVWPLARPAGEYLLDRIYVDDKRHWPMPEPAEVAAAETMPMHDVLRFRTGAWAGKMESKYTYAANYEENGAWGFASDTRKLGAWIVLGNYEYLNDGPHKQDLTALDGTFTLYLNRSHYEGTPIQVQAGEEWSKMFGPFLLFFNSGLPADALWSDARAQATLEHEQWPYAWLAGVPEYPTGAARGLVRGRLLVADVAKPRQEGAYAHVGLVETRGGEDFQTEAKGYQYWTMAKADGSFFLAGVRPGSYTLFAYLDGEVGQYRRENVTIEAGQRNALGNVTWTVPRAGGHLAWEIGYPNRDSSEFRHGNDFFTPYLYKTFAQEFPNPLVYDADHGDARREWNYAQSMYAGADGRAVPWRWTVRFHLANVPADGEAALHVALAGSNGARLRLTLNGRKLDEFVPKLDGGDALLRQSSYAKYSSYSIPVPLSALRAGENALDLDMISTAGEASAIFYDYLALELP